MDTQHWQRLSPLLDTLLDLPSEQQETYLQTLRQTDPSLAAELDRLLALDTGDSTFLDLPAIPITNELTQGTRIGPYRLERLLGEGGMGQVWLAERADGLYERKVALKLLRAGLVDLQLRQRFDREREILARFTHPHIARLLDAGISANGQPYLALDYVQGEPITRYCQARHLDIRSRLKLFRQVCDAVSHAHANLIVHRDLKPSNIIVTPSGHACLLDFGIAKLLDVKLLPVEQTRTGVRAFTLHYAAPEQIRGEPVTTMTDVYSLGVVLYELLTGTNKPYRLKRETDAEWEEAILQGEPVKPSLAVLRTEDSVHRPYTSKQLARELNGDLDNIILKALNKDPAQRYGSVEAFAQDLQNYLHDRPVIAQGERLGYRLRKYISRHRWALAATVAALSVVVSVLSVISWQAQRALREAGRAQAMQRFIAELFQDAGSTPNAPIDLRSLLELGIQRGELTLSRQPQARAELYGVVAQLQLKLGDYRKAQEVLEQQADLLKEISDAPASLYLEAATLHGDVHHQLGESAACIDLMQPLESRARREESQLPQQVSAFYIQIGRCQRILGHADGARKHFDRALEIRTAKDDFIGVAEAQLEISTLLSSLGQSNAAIQTLESGLLRLQKRNGLHHPVAIDMLRTACSLERTNDRLDAAVKNCDASLKLAQELHGSNHRATIDTSRQLAALYVDLGRFNEAEAIFLTAYAWMQTRLDEQHPDMARLYNSLAIVAWERGDIPRAIQFQNKSIGAWRTYNNAGLTAGSIFNLALILHNAGQHQDALVYAEEAMALRIQQFGADHEIIGDSARLLGDIYFALGRLKEAHLALQQAVQLTRAGFGSEHSHTRRAEISLARLEAWQNNSQAHIKLQLLGQVASHDSEQRKATWLARAYSAELDCAKNTSHARLALDAAIAEMRFSFPEGGSVLREVQQIRQHCAPSTRMASITL